MKKLLIILIGLCSCGYSAADFTKAVVVVDIESMNRNTPSVDKCYYYITPVVQNRVEMRGYFVDKCGKYTVGDTIKIVKR